MLRGGIWKPWNFMAIKCMCKQWIPGSLLSPPNKPGNKAMQRQRALHTLAPKLYCLLSLLQYT